MSLESDLEECVAETHRAQWVRRDGTKVPDEEDLALSNDAVEIDATVLYADLAQSTKMVETKKDWFAAEIYKNYLYCAARIIRSNGGVITAYDGDRIMAVFIGDAKNTKAAKVGLKINYAVINVLQPAIQSQYPEENFQLRQRVGVATSGLFVARTGIRGSNDLVWVGNAANHAAKMAALPTDYTTYISGDVYDKLNESSIYGGDPRRNMWTDLGSRHLGYRMYGSTWWWSL
ncbi:adenylate/guanylate cyclase domain-containing protein [Mycobacterium sp. URHB0021]